MKNQAHEKSGGNEVGDFGTDHAGFGKMEGGLNVGAGELRIAHQAPLVCAGVFVAVRKAPEGWTHSRTLRAREGHGGRASVLGGGGPLLLGWLLALRFSPFFATPRSFLSRSHRLFPMKVGRWVFDGGCLPKT